VLADRLFGVSETRLIALNVEDGALVWSVVLGGDTPGPVATADAVLMSEGAWLRAYRPQDGRLLWQQEVGAAAHVRMTVDASVIVVALEDRTLAAFDRASGRPLWREPTAISVMAVLLSGDRVYLGGAEGFACAHKLEHGRQDWCFNVRVTPIGTPVTDAQYVYFTFLDNMVHVFDRGNGRRFFTPSLGALPSDGPTLTQEALIVPIVTGEFVLLNPRDRFSAARVSSPRVAELPSTRAAAVAPDGGTLVMAIASPGGRSLMCFRRAPLDAPAKTDGTASDTPPAPPAP
jgi:outer membrane protein assembly factor BamB